MASVGRRGRAFAQEMQATSISSADKRKASSRPAAQRGKSFSGRTARRSKISTMRERILTGFCSPSPATCTWTSSSGVWHVGAGAYELDALAREISRGARNRDRGEPRQMLNRLVPAVVAEDRNRISGSWWQAAKDGAVDARRLFRLDIGRWAMEEGALSTSVPVRPSNLRIIEFDYDVSEFLGARTIASALRRQHDARD